MTAICLSCWSRRRVTVIPTNYHGRVLGQPSAYGAGLLELHFADLEDGLSVGVVGNIGQESGAMGGQRGLKFLHGIEHQMTHGKVGALIGDAVVGGQSFRSEEHT